MTRPDLVATTRAATLLGVTLVSATLLASSAHAAPLAGPAPSSPAMASSAGTSAEGGPAMPTIDWGNCDKPVSLPWGAECGQMKAPLDYSQPDAEQVTLTLARIKAYDQAARKGTIFINPGGPGGSAVKAVRRFAETLSEDIQNTYDIVGLDPRGTGYSEAFSCGNYPDGPDVPVFPLKPGDAAHILSKEAAFRDACREANPRIGRFMTTTDLARDLDRAREAVGDDQINFVGTSYGTYVAATYANMFPTKVRTIVADSAIDPIAWRDGRGASRLTSPVFARLGGVYGAQKAIDAAFSDCENAGQAKCPYARTIRTSWDTLHSDKGKAATYTYMGTEFSYDAIAAGFLGGWYSPEGVVTNLAMISTFAGQLNTINLPDPAEPHSGQPEPNQPDPNQPRVERPNPADEPHTLERLRAFQQHIKRAGQLTTTPEMAASNTKNANDSTASENRPAFPWLAQEMFGVMCSETANPTDVTAVAKTGQHYDKVVPGEGNFRTWQSSACSHWPLRGKNIYSGRFDHKTSNGVLIVSNEYDTATPHEQGAKKLHALLPGSKLVTVAEGYGHGAMFYSSCARKHISDYLVSGELPAEDATCKQDAPLFP